ncbi:MAG: PKD domain-containing protein [Flavobacteriaceae bacterium]|nr:PKD domain-containing protein [Flavobacteriaceae bacterium]
MRKHDVTYRLFILMLLCSLCLGCWKEQALPIEVDFSYEIVNAEKTIPVQIQLVNKTTGAEAYTWEFEQGTPESSRGRNPGVIAFNKPGTFKIKLYAENKDGSKGEKEVTITTYDRVTIDFDVQAKVDTYSPVTAIVSNKTIGANSFVWEFEGGNPGTYKGKTPPEIRFDAPGEHQIKLKVSNGLEQFEKTKSIRVSPFLIADFEQVIAFEDSDYQVPLTLDLKNKSISATSYQWTFEGADISNSEATNPRIHFETPGSYTITLTSTNGKETKTISQDIQVFANTNLLVFKDVKLGINSAHKQDKIGAFFSAKTGKVYSKSQLTQEIGSLIDIVYFGLNDSFSFNQFLSPDKAQNAAFTSIPNAQATKIINRLDSCNCGLMLSAAEFDSMSDDHVLKQLSITETLAGSQEFDSTVIPRIVLFQTADNRKGAIKINSFNKENNHSYIRCDIKIMKQPN